MSIKQLEEFKQFDEDMHWIFMHYEELAKSYPEKYIAVYRGKILDNDSEIKKLMSRLRKKYNERASFLAIEFITAKKDELIL